MSDQPPQSSDITGVRAVVFVGLMFIIDIAGAMIANNPDVTKLIFGASFALAAGAWAVSRILPSGWLNYWQTVLLAAVLFGSTVGVILLRLQH